MAATKGMSIFPRIRATAGFAILLGAPLSAAWAEGEVQAATPGAPAGTQLELNKLEPYDKGCRAYVVVNNPGATDYQSLKLDLVLFQTDGVIGKRFALDLAPVKPEKKTVKLFDIEGVACDKIGSFLINDVIDCKAAGGSVDGCLSRLTTSSLTKVQLSK